MARWLPCSTISTRHLPTGDPHFNDGGGDFVFDIFFFSVFILLSNQIYTRIACSMIVHLNKSSRGFHVQSHESSSDSRRMVIDGGHIRHRKMNLSKVHLNTMILPFKKNFCGNILEILPAKIRLISIGSRSPKGSRTLALVFDQFFSARLSVRCCSLFKGIT